MTVGDLDDMRIAGNRQFVLARLPDGPLSADCFRLQHAAIPVPKDGEVLLETRYVSIDAAMPGQSLLKQPRVEPLSHLLSVYGVSGLTAYFGVREVGQAKPGATRRWPSCAPGSRLGASR